MNTDIIAIFTENGFIIDTEVTKSKSFYMDEALLSDFKIEHDKTFMHLGFKAKAPNMSQSLLFLHRISSYFIDKVSKDPDIDILFTTDDLTNEEISYLLQKIPYAIGSEFIDASWITRMWNNLSSTFATELSFFDGSATQYLLMHNSNINVAGRVFFHLVTSKDDFFPFAFLATYSRKTPKGNKVEHVPLKNALNEYKNDQTLLLQLLATVSKATDQSNFISSLVESGELFSPLKFTADEAYTFLKEIPLYEQCGIMCRIPDWWKKKANSLKVGISIGGKTPSQVGLDALLSFDPELSLGDEKMTREELKELLMQTEGLSLLKGKWIEIDHEKLRATLEAYDSMENIAKDGTTLREAMQLQMGLNKTNELFDDEIVEVSNGEWLSNILNTLKTPEKLSSLSTGKDFKAKLRHYQQSGFDWLATMKNTGFGALLADDMGLGKTVQILALLEYMRKNNGEKVLLIIPASLIGNWSAEIERFTPKLKYSILHGANTNLELNESDLFITTYGMASKIEALSEHTWDIIILDEAQAIKNPGTKQTKAVKSIPAKFHIAMTGTPVENRMSDLWSLFDFLNKGLLGTPKEFSDYAKEIQNTESYTKLRNIISPFILRRLKTDKTIIDDLPDKVEMKAYATLSKKQVALYTSLVKDLKQSIDSLEGIERKGIVLASLMKFKQICNHPDQYLGQNVYEHKYSGKFKLLNEICETVHEKHERMLIFTQFREMCEPLSEYLETIFGKQGLVLHGGTPVKKRTELVKKFNDENEYIPYMVLSLKAGGVGLNLTSANHVVHFDRWWNPAVENQATDRAFRIGQKKNVLVHKLITTGTIEEKIDKMIEKKLKLSNDIIAGSGENWITEMDSKELMNLFTLEV